MLSRIALRASARVASRPSSVAITTRGFTNSVRLMTPPDSIQERHVPVTSYKDGVAEHEILEVKESADGPVNPGGMDSESIAQAFKPSVMEHMTPTLAKFTLTGKTAVMTGAGRGLGLNMAQAFVEAGVTGLAIFDVQQEIGEKSARLLAEQTGIDVRFYKVDVRDSHAVQNAVNDVHSHYGKIDTLVSAAGIADSNIKAENYDVEKFRRLLDINITGSFLVAQAIGRHMIHDKTGGSIVFIASMSGSIVNYPQEQSCYNASKAAVVQMTKSLAAEWARHQIRVNAISPGYMDTALNRVPALEAQKRIWIDQTPQKRLGAVDDLNGLAVFLASDASAFMTGANNIIDGGYSLW